MIDDIKDIDVIKTELKRLNAFMESFTIMRLEETLEPAVAFIKRIGIKQIKFTLDGVEIDLRQG